MLLHAGLALLLVRPRVKRCPVRIHSGSRRRRTRRRPLSASSTPVICGTQEVIVRGRGLVCEPLSRARQAQCALTPSQGAATWRRNNARIYRGVSDFDQTARCFDWFARSRVPNGGSMPARHNIAGLRKRSAQLRAGASERAKSDGRSIEACTLEKIASLPSLHR